MKKLLTTLSAFALSITLFSQVEIEPFAPSVPGTYLGDFDNVTSGLPIPDNSTWTEEGNTATNDWLSDNGATINFGGNPNYAYASIIQTEDLTLVSPEMDFGLNTTGTNLAFSYTIDDGTAAGFAGLAGIGQLEVLYKETAGGSWNVMATYSTANNMWAAINIDLNAAGVTDFSALYIGFRATTLSPGIGFAEGLVLIDDIVVTGNPSCSNTTNSFPIVECDSYTVPSTDEMYTASNNNVKDTIPNMAGCDSLLTIDLTINYSNTGSDVQAACDSLVWIDGNTYYTNNNSATYIETNQDGCDSVVTLDLTVTTIDNSVTNADPILTSNETGAAYVWLDCDNNDMPVGGANNQAFTATSNGNYSVEITLNGCKDTSACNTIATLGIDENDFQEILMYPNPTIGNVTIDFGTMIEATVKIHSADGKLVCTHQQNGQESIQFEFNEPKGIYFVEISNEKELINKRLVKN